MPDDKITPQVSEDQQYLLSVYNSRVDAEVKLWKAKADWNRAVMEITERQISAAGALMRLEQLRQTLCEFKVAFQHCATELRNKQRMASIVSGSIRSASKLLTGRVADLSRSWMNFWRVVSLAGVSAKIATAKVMFDGVFALEYFQEHRVAPAMGSSAWIALSDIFTILDAEARTQLESLQKEIAEEEAKLTALRNQRWDAVSTVGLKPST